MADRILDPRLTRRANAAAIDAGLSTLPRLSVEQVAARVIADCGGDPRAAVSELVAIVGALLEENRALARAASPGYVRQSPATSHLCQNRTSADLEKLVHWSFQKLTCALALPIGARCETDSGSQPFSYATSRSVSPSAFDNATRWPPGISSTSFPSLSRTTRR
jgi:hypothetical protein